MVRSSDGDNYLFLFIYLGKRLNSSFKRNQLVGHYSLRLRSCDEDERVFGGVPIERNVPNQLYLK